MPDQNPPSKLPEALKSQNPVTQKELEQWIKKIKEHSIKDSHDPVSFLVRQCAEGLDNPLEMLAFLKSKGGIIFMNMVRKELASIVTNDRDQAFEANEEARAQQRMMAFLLLYFAHKKALAKSKSLTEFIQEQINKLLKKPRENKLEMVSLAKESKALELFDKYLNDLYIAKQEELALENNYQSLIKNIDKLDAFSDSLANPALSHEDIEMQINKELSHLNKKISGYNELLNQYQNEGKASEEQIDTLKNKLQGRMLRVQGLEDYLKKHTEKGDSEGKHFDSDGNETSSIKDAVLSLRRDSNLKVLVKDGEAYLVNNSTQSLDELTPADKMAANQRFKNSINTQTVQKDARKYMGLSQEAHKLTLSSVDDRPNEIKAQMVMIQNQRLQIQSAQAQLQEAMRLNMPEAASNVNIPTAPGNVSVNRTAPPAATTPRANVAANPNMNVNNNTPELTPLANTPSWRTVRDRQIQIRRQQTTARNVLDDRRAAEQNITKDALNETKNTLRENRLETKNTVLENKKIEADKKRDTAPKPFNTTPSPYRKI